MGNIRWLVLVLFAGICVDIPAQPTAFTYQGSLGESGAAAQGVYDFTFALYNAPAGGNPVGASQSIDDLAVTGGVFTVMLDFGAAPFDGGARWLQIGVRPGASTGTHLMLTPRQPMTVVPYALRAQTVAENSIDTAQIKDGAITSAKISGAAEGGWALTGNAGTSAATNFVGTTDSQPLVFKVNGRRVMQIEDATDAASALYAVNVVGGAAVNHIEPGVLGATISGGGQGSNDGFGFPNDIRGNFGFIGGGSANFIDAFAHGVIGGGAGNVAQGNASTIAGGASNNTQSDYATIGGGQANFAFGTHSTVAGGFQNSSSGIYDAVGGGKDNTAAGSYSTISGGIHNETADIATTVGGGWGNRVTQLYGTVAGGTENEAHAQASVIAGGRENTNGGWYASIGGGYQNRIADHANGSYAVIGGGYQNSVSGAFGVIGGGDKNTVNGRSTVIAGGTQNYAWSVSDYSAIGGGYQNSAYGDYATIPGGYRNYADGLGSFAAGIRAYAAHDGSFVWADNHDADFVSTAANQFCVRASGGVIFEAFASVAFYSGVGTTEANRYFLLLNSPRAPSASGLKAGGILCSDSFDYANPGKNDMVVKGTLGVGYPNPAPYRMAVNGTVYSAGGYSSSDIRRKKNVEPISHGLEQVLKLRGVSFEWRRDEFHELNLDEGRQIGLIAQEVEQVLPEVVSTDAEGYKAIAYQNIVPVLIEAIKEQQKTIDQLQSRLSSMQRLAAEIQSIKAQLAARPDTPQDEVVNQSDATMTVDSVIIRSSSPMPQTAQSF